MNDEIKFDLDKDIIMQIEMASYAEYNDTLAMMNDHLGEIYGYSNLKDAEEAQLHYEKELAYKAIKELQQENERLKAKYNNKSHEVNYKYFTTLYSKATKDIVIDDLVYKCEDLDNLRQSYEKLYIEKEDYKSRCEKASEYIKNCEIVDKDKRYPLSEEQFGEDLLNILQNGSDENVSDRD